MLDSKYKLKTTADGGFIYCIYVPELGREVEGEVAKSKKAKYSQENYKIIGILVKKNIALTIVECQLPILDCPRNLK